MGLHMLLMLSVMTTLKNQKLPLPLRVSLRGDCMETCDSLAILPLRVAVNRHHQPNQALLWPHYPLASGKANASGLEFCLSVHFRGSVKIR